MCKCFIQWASTGNLVAFITDFWLLTSVCKGQAAVNNYVNKPKHRYAPFWLGYLLCCALCLGLFAQPAPIHTLCGRNVATRHSVSDMALGKLFTGRRICPPVQSPSLLLAAYAAENDVDSVRSSTVRFSYRYICVLLSGMDNDHHGDGGESGLSELHVTDRQTMLITIPCVCCVGWKTGAVSRLVNDV